MLARTFKTAAELGIPEHEAHALQTVLYMLEDGQIKSEQVYMYNWHGLGACGTTHCLAGWAHEIDAKAFQEINEDFPVKNLTCRLPTELAATFGINNARMMYATADQATHYLETGICNRK
jgi:hypothetical protein